MCISLEDSVLVILILPVNVVAHFPTDQCNIARSTAPLCASAEIGATAKSPADKTMKKGVSFGYCIILSAYLTVSISGGCHYMLAPYLGLSVVLASRRICQLLKA